jgi:3-mercaptopyruvate sulfurtransferase SseA
LTSEDGRAAALAARQLSGGAAPERFLVLSGGIKAWKAAGLPLESGAGTFLTEPEDYWYRPYMDPEASDEAKKAYFEWEAGLTRELRAEPNGSFDNL